MTAAIRGAQATGRDERKVRTLERMIREQGLPHVVGLVQVAARRAGSPGWGRIAALVSDLVKLGVPIIAFLACSGADFGTANPGLRSGPLELPDSGSPIVRSRMPQDALPSLPDADAGLPLPEGTGGILGAGGAGSGGAVTIVQGAGGSGGALVVGSGGALSSGGSSSGGSVSAGTGGAVPFTREEITAAAIHRADCTVRSSQFGMVKCILPQTPVNGTWNYAVGVTCQNTVPLTPTWCSPSSNCVGVGTCNVAPCVGSVYCPDAPIAPGNWCCWPPP